MPFRAIFAKLLTTWLKPTFINNTPIALEIDPKLEMSEVRYVLDCDSFSDRALLAYGCKLGELPEPVTIEPDPDFYWCLRHREGLLGRRSPRANGQLSLKRNLIEASTTNPRLIPVSVYWGHQPDRNLSIWKAVLSDQWGPTSRFRKLLCILFTRRHILVQFGPALPQASILDEGIANAQRAHRLLRGHFKRQRQLIIGPDLSHRRTLIDELLTAANVQSAIDTLAETESLPRHQVAAKAYRYAQEIASDQSYRVVRFFNILLTWLWNRLYDGIEVNHLDRVRAASEQSEIVYVPCHRSHIDYLLLSYVLYHNGLALPHIAAGNNLDLPIIGPLLRRAGAFFMRRSFRENPLYKSVFDEYLHLLLSRGYSVEYFIEGGRSRLGRMRSPRAGMINMTLRAFYRDHRQDVQFVPVYFSYDRVLEISSYQKELDGQAKKTESIFDLIGVIRLFKLAFGQVHVNFGSPISLAQYLETHTDEPLDSITEPSHRDLCQHLGNHIAHRINASITVTPVQLFAIIMSQSPTGTLPLGDVASLMRVLQAVIRSDAISSLFDQPDLLLLKYVAKTAGAEIESSPDGEVITAEDRLQIGLNYYENSAIHLLILPSLIANYLLEQAGTGVAVIDIIRPVLSALNQRFLYVSPSDDVSVVSITESVTKASSTLIPSTQEPIDRSDQCLTFIAAIIWPALSQLALASDLLGNGLSHQAIIEGTSDLTIDLPSSLPNSRPLAGLSSPEVDTALPLRSAALRLDANWLEIAMNTRASEPDVDSTVNSTTALAESAYALLPPVLSRRLRAMASTMIKENIPTMTASH